MDELERRRQQRRFLRQQRQEQRKQQNRKLYIRLAIAGVAILATAVVVLAVSCRQQTPEQPPEQTTAATTPVTDPTTLDPTGTTAPTATGETTAPATTVVNITAVGDLNVTEKTVAAGGAGYDYTAVFQDVIPVLAQADLTVVNFEGILCGAPYGTEDRSAPQTMLTALKTAGVDLVQTANSYTIKNGVSGLSLTLSSLQAAGLESVGAYATNQAYDRAGGYTLRTVNGVKIAFVALTKGMDGMALPGGSERCVNLLYTDYSTTYKKVDTEGIRKLMSRVAKEKPDITVALVHWGSEFNDTHSDSQLQIEQLLLETGADAIIGTHPHYVQQIKYDPQAGTVVAYSLGDFFSDASRSGTEYSIALHLEVTKDHATGDAAITGWEYTPLFTATQPDGSLRVVRLDAAVQAYEENYLGRVDKAVYDAMVYARQRIEDRITPEN